MALETVSTEGFLIASIAWGIFGGIFAYPYASAFFLELFRERKYLGYFFSISSSFVAGWVLVVGFWTLVVSYMIVVGIIAIPFVVLAGAAVD